jgi:hypothetical protein
LLLTVFFKGRDVWLKQKEMHRLFSFLLLFGGFANILSHVPSVGRFNSLATLFYTGFLFLYFFYNNSEQLSKRLFFYLTPAFLLFFIVVIRTGFDNTGVFAFITNPIIAPFLTNEIALIDLIK